MKKILISMPEDLAIRMKATIPARQRSKIITRLIAGEVAKLEKRQAKHLHACAIAVEKDSALNREMEDWDITLQDGLDDEAW